MVEHRHDEMVSPEAGRPAEDAVEQVRSTVIDLVAQVLRARKAHAAYEVFSRIEAFAGERYERDDVYEAFLGTALVMAATSGRAAAAAGREGAEAVAWVRNNLGAWASGAAARTGVTLGIVSSSAGARPDVTNLQDDLREHALPATVWLIAGIVAVAGAGDADWLRRLSDS